MTLSWDRGCGVILFSAGGCCVIMVSAVGGEWRLETAGVERDRAGAGAGTRLTSAAGTSDAARALLRVIGGPGRGAGAGGGAIDTPGCCCIL